MVIITFGVIFHGDAIKPNLCLFVHYSHQRDIKNHGFNHNHQNHTIKYIPVIKTLYQFHRVTNINFILIISAVTLGVNQDIPAALTTAEQVLDSLLFDDLLYFVADNDKDEQKFCNMRFDMD